MLVLDPPKRYTIDQIKQHSWMTAETVDIPKMPDISGIGGTSNVEPSEQILKLMSSLHIDAQKTRESLKVLLNNN